MSRMVHVVGPDDYYMSPLYEEMKFVVAGNLKVYDACMFNNSAAQVYLLIFDKASAPVANDVPCAAPVPVPAGTMGWYTPNQGKQLKLGLGLAASSTPEKYTAIGVNSFLLETNYRVR